MRARLDEQMQIVREMHETLLRLLGERNEADRTEKRTG